MDGRHVELTLKDLHDQQQAIDSVIESLLNFTPAVVTNSSDQQRRKSGGNIETSATSASSPSLQVRKVRGPGRPPKAAVPPPSPAPLESTRKFSPDVLIECLNKINEQNKKLLNFVEVLAEKVEKKTSEESATVSQGENPVSINQNTVLEGVNNRLEKIEQNLNSNTLICRGLTVEKFVTESASGETTNLELLKGKVCAAVCGDEITGVNVHDLQLSLYGRDKKCIRLNCNNLATKIHLLKQAREKKPTGLFLNEFLTTTKLKIYKNLRQLKSQHPDKIKAVFTRYGNILYTLHNSSQIFQASSLADLSNIVSPEPPATNSVSN